MIVQWQSLVFQEADPGYILTSTSGSPSLPGVIPESRAKNKLWIFHQLWSKYKQHALSPFKPIFLSVSICLCMFLSLLFLHINIYVSVFHHLFWFGAIPGDAQNLSWHWLCAQGSLLIVLRGPYVGQGLNWGNLHTVSWPFDPHLMLFSSVRSLEILPLEVVTNIFEYQLIYFI